MIKQSYDAGYQAAFDKIAGGPGSGVTGNNTAKIEGYPRSKHISVATRKALLENMAYEKRMVPVSAISHIHQENYIPEKLERFLKDPSIVTKEPIDVLVAQDEVTLCDGAHRLLAAKKLGIKELPARVYTKRRANGKPMRLDTALKK